MLGSTSDSVGRSMTPRVVMDDASLPFAFRITSYNVCYTKLLRLEAHAAFVGALRDQGVEHVGHRHQARGQQSDLQAGAAAGCDGYLTKPFSPLELIDTVDGLLARQEAETI